MHTKETLEIETKTLELCPFCAGKAHFSTNKSEQILLEHFPESGVICPARSSQFCESFDEGRRLWNNRPTVSAYPWFQDIKAFVERHIRKD